MEITANQRKYIYTLMNKLGINEYKEDLSYNISNYRTSHLSELTSDEAGELISYLRKMEHNERKERNQLRRAIIHRVYKTPERLRWWKYEGEKKKFMPVVFNRWLKKDFNQLTKNELSRLVAVMDRVVKHYNDKEKQVKH